MVAVSLLAAEPGSSGIQGRVTTEDGSALPGVSVTAELPVVDSGWLERRELDRYLEDQARQLFAEQVVELRQGVAGGVKPLAVAIPESGKALLLAGALPPPAVALELDVRGPGFSFGR